MQTRLPFIDRPSGLSLRFGAQSKLDTKTVFTDGLKIPPERFEYSLLWARWSKKNEQWDLDVRLRSLFAYLRIVYNFVHFETTNLLTLERDKLKFDPSTLQQIGIDLFVKTTQSNNNYGDCANETDVHNENKEKEASIRYEMKWKDSEMGRKSGAINGMKSTCLYMTNVSTL
ncbi:hypothetical protein RFI_21701 [Reticulomyxa filosa]|uniref:Uncharacterized protein n=1 Tax=Reticulomyxa filosa TaxID=46433 RepID=X6MNT6_RETFI|nr:hypothetical protein RFI_21701 [Reticulomyxa filosa]|eukprot:ETO15663.1 hypothetical protein RFI_21701 [Reticulomyxa filosa]